LRWKTVFVLLSEKVVVLLVQALWLKSSSKDFAKSYAVSRGIKRCLGLAVR
jgi:hypothetical protein